MTDLEVLTADCAADPQLREVFMALPEYYAEVIPYARQQARDLGMPVERWRHHVARLIALGLATYGPVFDRDDGHPRGSSYWLTARGTAVREAFEAQS